MNFSEWLTLPLFYYSIINSWNYFAVLINKNDFSVNYSVTAIKLSCTVCVIEEEELKHGSIYLHGLIKFKTMKQTGKAHNWIRSIKMDSVE